MSKSSGKKRAPVVVIGAGASGLAAIKTCLEDGITDVICYEKTNDIGGLWHFREEVIDGVASVMKSTVINSCKEMTAYSDYPPPEDFPNFMHNRHLATYFEMYADNFKLRKYIRHRHEVLSLVQRPDFAKSGEWTVTTKHLDTGKEESVLASAVLVCAGHHAEPHVPEFPGLDQFKGFKTHTHSYKDYKGLEDKRVLVIGVGNSGGDVAVELNRIATQVYLSTRRGTWVIYRVGIRGLPTDYITLRRAVSWLPRSMLTYYAEAKQNSYFDHKLYNLKPRHRFFAQHPTINDALPNCILCGTVQIKNDIHRFVENGVIFKGEENKVYELDAVILATGYNITFPFIDQKLVSVQRNRVNLYKYVFEPSIQPPTLAIIGLVQPLGSIVPMSELQARIAVRVFNGNLQLPSRQDMEDDIQRLRAAMDSRYVESQRHTIQVDYMEYMDDIGHLLGVVPDLRKMLLSDPVLAFRCFFGANLPYQYRLTGPHPWAGARQAILGCPKRVAKPLATFAGYDQLIQKKTSKVWRYLGLLFALFVVYFCFTLA